MVIGATLCWLSGQNMLSQALAGPGAAAAASVLAGQRFRVGREWTGINSRCLQRMETEIAQLVSEAFVCKQPRDIQQEQLMRDNAAAVREAILVHARPILAALGRPFRASPTDCTQVRNSPSSLASPHKRPARTRAAAVSSSESAQSAMASGPSSTDATTAASEEKKRATSRRRDPFRCICRKP